MSTPNPLVIPAGFAQCTFRVQNVDLNRIASFSIGAHLGVDEASLAANLHTWFFTAGAPHFVSELATTWAAINVEVVGHTAMVNSPGFTQGQVNAAYLPPNCAAKIRKFTGQRGKANKGAMFWPGYCADGNVNNDGSQTVGAIANTQINVNGLSTAIAADGSSPYLLHHILSSTTIPTAISALQVEPQVATQRRRLSPRP